MDGLHSKKGLYRVGPEGPDPKSVIKLIIISAHSSTRLFSSSHNVFRLLHLERKCLDTNQYFLCDDSE